jgi:hypothetical protein
MRKIPKLILLMLSISVLCYAQDENLYKHFRPESPAVSQFLQYDEMPVSEYTGIPEISVPLYTIETDDFKLPLTLTYHAGGIKVNQQANWVGLGWNLSVGSIVQIINDEDDLGIRTKNKHFQYDDYFYFDNRVKMLPDYPNSNESYEPFLDSKLEHAGKGCLSFFPRLDNSVHASVSISGYPQSYGHNEPVRQHIFKLATNYI